MKPNILKLYRLLFDSSVSLKIGSQEVPIKDASPEHRTLFLSPLIDLSSIKDLEQSKPDINQMIKIFQILTTIKTKDLFRICIIGDFIDNQALQSFHPYEDEHIQTIRLNNITYFSLKRIELEKFMDKYWDVKDDILILSPRACGVIIPEMSSVIQYKTFLSTKSYYTSCNQLPDNIDYLGMNLMNSTMGSLQFTPSEYDIVRAIKAYNFNDLDLNIELLENFEKPFVQNMVTNMLACNNMHKAQYLIIQVLKQLKNTTLESLIGDDK